MTDTTDPEYYQRIRGLSQALADRRWRSGTVRRHAEALAPLADLVLTLPFPDNRTVANELLARYILTHRGGLPDSLALFLAIGEALHESKIRRARSLLVDLLPPPQESLPVPTTDTAHAAASTLIDVRHDPRRFLAQADNLRRLRENYPEDAQLWILRHAVGLTPAEVASLLGSEEKSVARHIALFEHDLAAQPG